MLKSTVHKHPKTGYFTFFLSLLSRRWIISTIFVTLAIILMIRLGTWQLDRLEQRRSLNSQVLAQIYQPEISLNNEFSNQNLQFMEYREIVVKGTYDHSQEIILLNQYEGNQWGVHLITPLLLDNSGNAVLVDRGWIPAEIYQSGKWGKLSEPGIVKVNGVIRLPRSKADFGSRQDQPSVNGGSFLKTWNFVNIELIQKQMPYQLLPVYIQQSPNSSQEMLPVRSSPELDLTEGPHLGYAIQWFLFAIILGSGYSIYINRHAKNSIQ